MEVSLLRAWKGGGAEKGSTVGMGFPGGEDRSVILVSPPTISASRCLQDSGPLLEGHGMGFPLRVQVMSFSGHWL